MAVAGAPCCGSLRRVMSFAAAAMDRERRRRDAPGRRSWRPVEDARIHGTRNIEGAHPRDRAHAVLLVGHSGGAAIAANILGRHPGIADGAVLVGCGCDPSAWRARRRAETGNSFFDGPTRSLLPLEAADAVAPGAIVRMVVGEDDDVAPAAYSQSYAAALRKRGIDVSVDVVPGLGHNILFAAPVLKAVEDVLRKLPAP